MSTSILGLVGCLVWIPIAIWVYSLISAAIMGEIDGLTGIVGAFLGLALGVFVMIQPNPNLTPMLLLAVVSLMVLTPLLRRVKDNREFATMEVESVERAYEQLSLRPDNLGSVMRIAKILHSRGLTGHSIAIAEKVLKNFQTAIVADDWRTVRQWKAMATPESSRPLPCLQCHVKNDPGNVYCVRCGCPFLLAYVRGQWAGPQMMRKLLASWVASVAALVGIPMAATTLPSTAAGAVVISLLGLSGAIVFAAFRPGRT